MEIQYAVLNEIGLERKENQDAVFCASYDSTGIFLVADGMGGHTNGGRASRTIKKKVEAWWIRYKKNQEQSDFFQTIEEIKTVLASANEEILENTKEGEICGSTVVLLWIQKNAWALFSCGDSRCYQINNSLFSGRIHQLTTDDVWENQRQNIDGLSKEEIQQHVNFGRLIRAVGTEPNLSCTVRSDRWKDKTVFALCSDGIYKYCSEKFFKKMLQKTIKAECLKSCIEEIRSEVYQNGAPDNLSFIFVSVSEEANGKSGK